MSSTAPNETTPRPDIPPPRIASAETSGGTADDDLFRRIKRVIVAQRSQQITDTRASLQKKFDLANFECLKKAIARELTPEDHAAVGKLYGKLEMDSDVFYELFIGEYDSADAHASEGGMIHSWQPSAGVLQELKKECPNYVSPADEFLTFLNGTHNRAADFRAWGMFGEDGELYATASGFFPSRNPHRRKAHARQIRRFFTRNKPGHKQFIPDPQSHIEQVHTRAAKTAEFFMIASDRPGAGTLVSDQMIQQLIAEKMEITDMYLLRFGSMKMVYPFEDNRVTHDAPNVSSRDFFRKRGFGDCGQWINLRERAFRETHAGIVVGVEPKWTVMHAAFSDVVSGSRTEVEYLEAEARAALSSPVPSVEETEEHVE